MTRDSATHRSENVLKDQGHWWHNQEQEASRKGHGAKGQTTLNGNYTLAATLTCQGTRPRNV